MEYTREEKSRFAAALAKVALVTSKNEKPDAPRVRLYFESLRDFSIETIEEVAEELIRTEQSMVDVPPPGRWRAVAELLFELKPPKPARSPGEAIRCEHCQDTGFRIGFYDENGVPRVEHCDHSGDGIPITDIRHEIPVQSMEELDGEWPPRAGESELQRHRRERGNRLLTCMCCGVKYRQRQGLRCACRPPLGTPLGKWMAGAHTDCPNPAPEAQGPSKTRCAAHCRCPRDAPRGTLPRPNDRESLADFFVRIGIRDKDAPREPPDRKALQAGSDREDDWTGFIEDEPPPHSDADR